jgi:hypothetical protein
VTARPDAGSSILFYLNKVVVRDSETKLSNNHLHNGGEGGGLTYTNDFLKPKVIRTLRIIIVPQT